jgi:hypothetical protein
MLIAAISGTVLHPLVAGLDDETLRSQLNQLARRLLPTMKVESKGVVAAPNELSPS